MLTKQQSWTNVRDAGHAGGMGAARGAGGRLPTGRAFPMG